jgi:DNA-directed RNA polymerase sigma subunit (sigma70/sigma32)
LRKLPGRQREVIVLRYYADFSEAEIAAAMGISRGAVKSHAARGMAALRAELKQQDRGVEALTPACACESPGQRMTGLRGRITPVPSAR